jgi:hypothetical protein
MGDRVTSTRATLDDLLLIVETFGADGLDRLDAMSEDDLLASLAAVQAECRADGDDQRRVAARCGAIFALWRDHRREGGVAT